MTPAGQPAAGRKYLDWRAGAILLGLLLTASVAAYKPIGVSTSYSTSWGMALAAVAPEWAAAHPYLQKVGTSVTPEWLLVLGLVIGAAAAAFLSRSRTREAVPAAWAERFGISARKRFAGAFLGGALFLFGARLAGGCTSGHIVSGISQLAVSSMAFAGAVFAAALITARLVYGKGAKS